MSEQEAKVSSKEQISDILLDEDMDFSFPEEVKELSQQNVYFCYQCGTCVSGCPVTDFGQNTKKLIRKIIFGLRDEVLEDDIIWLCTECYYCAQRCPQGVHLPTIWVTLRNMAAERGKIPMPIRAAITEIKNTGRIAEVSEAVEVRRERLNLQRAGTLSKEVTAEIGKIFDKTGFKLKKEEKKEDKK